MGEISIDPKFNIHETYKKVRILNPYRNQTGSLPIYFAKISHYLDAAVGVTKTQGAVTSWVDKKNSNDWVNYLAPANLGNGVDANGSFVSFHSNNSGLTFPQSMNDNKEVVIVMKRFAHSFNNYFIGGVENLNAFLYDFTNGGYYDAITRNIDTPTIHKNIGTSDLAVFNMSYISTQFGTNSAVLGSRSNASLGANANYYEVIFFSTALTVDERAALYVDLKNKYPAISNLP